MLEGFRSDADLVIDQIVRIEARRLFIVIGSRVSLDIRASPVSAMVPLGTTCVRLKPPGRKTYE